MKSDKREEIKAYLNPAFHPSWAGSVLVVAALIFILTIQKSAPRKRRR